MRKVSRNHLKRAHRALRLGFILVVVLLTQSGPSTAEADVFGFDFEGIFTQVSGSGGDALNIFKSVLTPGGEVMNTRFTGNFLGDSFNPGTSVGGKEQDVTLYEGNKEGSSMNVYVPFPTKSTDVIAFQLIGLRADSFVTVVNNSAFPPLTEPFKGDAFFFNSANNPGPVSGPCFTVAPLCTGGEIFSGSKFNAQLTLTDLKGDALTVSNPLIGSSSVVGDIARGGISAFPSAHFLILSLQTGGGISTYVGNLTGIGTQGSIAPEPSTVFLIGSGLVGLVWWHRKQSRTSSAQSPSV